MQHTLKTHPTYFRGIWFRDKLFECRIDDRNFQVGDKLILKEYDLNIKKKYTGRRIKATISYKLTGEEFGIKEGFCVLSLKDLTNIR